MAFETIESISANLRESMLSSSGMEYFKRNPPCVAIPLEMGYIEAVTGSFP